MITQAEALQITRRIQKISNALHVPEEIRDLANLLEDFLSQPGISSSNITKGNTDADDEIRCIHMKEMGTAFEMGRQDIILLARSQGSTAWELASLTNQEVETTYIEARDLFQQGLLESYLQHLTIQEEKHMAPPPKPTPPAIRVLPY